MSQGDDDDDKQDNNLLVVPGIINAPRTPGDVCQVIQIGNIHID